MFEKQTLRVFLLELSLVDEDVILAVDFIPSDWARRARNRLHDFVIVIFYNMLNQCALACTRRTTNYERSYVAYVRWKLSHHSGLHFVRLFVTHSATHL